MTTLFAGLAGAALALPGVAYVLSPALKARRADRWIPAGLLSSYPVGLPVPFSFTTARQHGWERSAESHGVFILRTSDGAVEVLSNVCTHLGCRVSWRAGGSAGDGDGAQDGARNAAHDAARVGEQDGEYVCPCHGARFDLQGRVLSGPAPRPLDRYETRLEGDRLYLHYREG